MPSKPILFYNPRSPPSRSVLLTAAAIGLELSHRLINTKTLDNLQPEFLKLNPQHTIPVLDDNGVIITDSHVICGYLVDNYATDDSLYPRLASARREVDTRLYLDCGHLFPRVRFMIEPVIHFGANEIGEDRIAYMQKGYDNLEYCFNNGKGQYLCLDRLTIADLCCLTSVTSAMSFAPLDAEKFPKLDAWVKRLSQLPYYDKNKAGLDVLVKFVEEQLAANKKIKEEIEFYE